MFRLNCICLEKIKKKIKRFLMNYSSTVEKLKLHLVNRWYGKDWKIENAVE